MSNYEIIEFEPKYTSAVIDVVSKVLRDQNVIPDSDEPSDNEDLYNIPAIYRGDVIGTIAITEMSVQTARLNRMFVLSHHRGLGIGQALLNHALDFARDQKYREVILNKHLLMKRAHRFYERNGFTKIREEDDSYHYRLSFLK